MGMNDGYPISVPVMSRVVNDETRQETLDQVRQSGAFRVWLADSQDVLFNGTKCETYELLKKNIAVFKEAGFEVGVWINSYGFGGPVVGVTGNENVEKAKDWTRITSIAQDGESKENAAFCPEDPGFVEAFCQQIRDIAVLKPDLIMLDDDLCLSVRPGIGCFCPRHMKLLETKLKQPLNNRKRFAELMFTYGRNVYRDGWLSVMRDTHKRFCTKVREALDEVDPTIRMGFCAGYTSWDIEGADAIQLTKILAGNTKPFLRFTSAPYWVTIGRNRFPGMKLNMVIEHARQQEAWCRDSGIEVFNENDTYPRPRYHVPASYMECFDLATRASGGMGSLKYLIDYCSTPDYETGYLKIHKRNEPLYRWIQEHFADKTADGVQIYRPMHTIKTAKLPATFDATYAAEKDIMRRVFAPEIAMLTQLSVPVRYDEPAEAPEYAAAFGDDVEYIPEDRFPKNLIIDVPAAKILMDNGVDVGLRSFEMTAGQGRETFTLPGSKKQTINITYPKVFRPGYLGSGFYRCEVSPDAQVQSWYSEDLPASYVYHNGTTRFLVLLADVDTLGQSCSFCASYARQKQILEFMDHKYPSIENEPDVYSLYKYNEDKTCAAVLFANLSSDMLFDFDIHLGKPCKAVKGFGLEGSLSEDGMRFHVTNDVPSMTVLVLEIEYK